MWNFRGYLAKGAAPRPCYAPDTGAGANGEGDGDGTQGGEGEKGGSGEKLFTREELNKIVAAEKAKAYSAAKAEKEEEARLAKLTEEEKLKESAKQYEEKYEAEKAARIALELKHDTIKALEEDGISATAAELVIGKNAEETQSRIKILKDVIARSIDTAKPEWLKGKTPEAKGGSGKSWTLEDLRNMSKEDMAANLKDINAAMKKGLIK